MLAVNGELDLQVPSKENLAEIDKALKSGGSLHHHPRVPRPQPLLPARQDRLTDGSTARSRTRSLPKPSITSSIGSSPVRPRSNASAQFRGQRRKSSDSRSTFPPLRIKPTRRPFAMTWPLRSVASGRQPDGSTTSLCGLKRNASRRESPVHLLLQSSRHESESRRCVALRVTFGGVRDRSGSSDGRTPLKEATGTHRRPQQAPRR